MRVPTLLLQHLDLFLRGLLLLRTQVCVRGNVRVLHVFKLLAVDLPVLLEPFFAALEGYPVLLILFRLLFDHLRDFDLLTAHF